MTFAQRPEEDREGSHSLQTGEGRAPGKENGTRNAKVLGQEHVFKNSQCAWNRVNWVSVGGNVLVKYFAGCLRHGKCFINSSCH